MGIFKIIILDILMIFITYGLIGHIDDFNVIFTVIWVVATITQGLNSILIKDN